MSTPADAFGSRWPLETVSVEFDELVLEDQIVVEFEKVLVGRDTLTGRVVERWYGAEEAIVFEDATGERWRVDEHGALMREEDGVSFGESATIEAVRELVPDGGRIRKRLPCKGDCEGQTEHVHLNKKNDVLRDVWRCTVCEGTRAGPILTQSDVEQTVATDGGER